MSMFQDQPIWLLFVLVVGALGLAREAGAWLHRRHARSAERGDEAHEGYLLSAVLGLLALLVAFTFGLALDRFERRRELVVAEANALGTAWLRAEAFTDGVQLQRLLRAYTAERLTYGRIDGAAQAAAAARAAALQPRIWSTALAISAPVRSTPLTPMLLDPLNQAFDAASSRQAELGARLPPAVLEALLLYALAAAAALGYSVSSGRHRAISAMLFVLLGLSILLIVDLDRPRSGAIRVPQAAMAAALEAMQPAR